MTTSDDNKKMRTSTPHSPEEAGIQDIAEGNRGS